ncbi:unnamed protein product [Gordionus sp. m RMFG-2023]
MLSTESFNVEINKDSIFEPDEGFFDQFKVFGEWYSNWNKHYADHSYQSSPKSKKRPDFCTVYECPKFTVLCNGQDFEVRMYQPISWAYSEVKSMSKIKAINTAFKRVFRYISGENDQSNIYTIK